jgi:hypothetical protein
MNQLQASFEAFEASRLSRLRGCKVVSAGLLCPDGNGNVTPDYAAGVSSKGSLHAAPAPAPAPALSLSLGSCSCSYPILAHALSAPS